MTWNRRKLITVNGSTAGAQSDYQMKLTVNQGSGTDSAGIVYLGGNVLDSFNDLRFAKSDGTTTLNYWIESIAGTSPNKTAIVWTKLAPSPDTIPASPGTYSFYIYYNNISAPVGSSDTNTFIRIINGVKGAWTLDGNALDTSGNNLNGTVNGVMGYTTGKFGQAGLFDGVNDGISLPATGISNENVPFTVSAWVYANSFTGSPFIFTNGTGSSVLSAKFHIDLRLNADGTILFAIGKSQAWDIGKLTTNIFNTGIWYHIVTTYDGSKTFAGFNIYVNSTLANMTNFGSVGTASTAYDGWYIGQNYGGGLYFNGIIDEARMYNRALTQAEVTDLHNNYGYTTTNYPGKELVRKYVSQEPIFSTTSIEELVTIIPAAEGGTVTTSGNYRIHTFTSSGAFIVNKSMNVETLVVAGGGGGGRAQVLHGGCGGGGAGGYRTATEFIAGSGSFSVTVGEGGTGALTDNTNGANGSNSTFSAITSIGGGGGAGAITSSGSSGGSGGGGGQTGGTGGTGTAGQGNNGATLTANYNSGNGGGGASHAGYRSTGSPNTAGAGGNGATSSISGISTTYAGGGGGGRYSTDIGGAGGIGGGGAGGVNGAGSSGVANTGGGGGGGVGNTNGGSGGSGIVIIRYLSSYDITATNMAVTPRETPCRVGICKVDVSVTWKNNGLLISSFVPSITVNSGTVETVYSSQNLTAGTSVTLPFTVSGMTIGTCSICPNPN